MTKDVTWPNRKMMKIYSSENLFQNNYITFRYILIALSSTYDRSNTNLFTILDDCSI